MGLSLQDPGKELLSLENPVWPLYLKLLSCKCRSVYDIIQGGTPITLDSTEIMPKLFPCEQTEETLKKFNQSLMTKTGKMRALVKELTDGFDDPAASKSFPQI